MGQSLCGCCYPQHDQFDHQIDINEFQLSNIHHKPIQNKIPTSDLKRSLLSHNDYDSQESALHTEHLQATENNSIDELEQQHDLSGIESDLLKAEIAQLDKRLDALHAEIEDSELECNIGAELQQKHVEAVNEPSDHSFHIETKSNNISNSLNNERTINFSNHSNFSLTPSPILSPATISVIPDSPIATSFSLDSNSNDDTLSAEELQRILQS
jgi:hypothetical protein